MNPLTTTNTDIAIAELPNQKQAALLLGIDPSQLSRLEDAQYEPAGKRGRHYRPAELMRLNKHHKRKSVNGLAADLVDWAAEHAPHLESFFEREVDTFMTETVKLSPLSPQAFAEAASSLVSGDNLEQLKTLYENALHQGSEDQQAR